MENKKPGLFGKIWHSIREMCRKCMVSLKRRPQMIPLIALAVTFIYYSFNLTHISDTTARIQGPNMGLACFATMLFSMLSFLCCLNAFPYRKKPVVVIEVLLYVMLVIIGFADYTYMNAILASINRADNPVVITQQTIYIKQAYDCLRNHMVMLIISAVLVATLPLYTKLLRKVKTSIDVEDNGEMGEIDIADED